MPILQSREPGFESLLMPFRSRGIFVIATMLQFTKLSFINEYLAIDMWWTCECLVVRNCGLARMFPREVELVTE